MDFNERFTAELNSKDRTPRQMISFLNGVIKKSEKQISQLKGDGKAATVTNNSEDGPQPSTKKDDANAKKQVVTRAKKLRAKAKNEVRSSRGGGGGGALNLARPKMNRPSGGSPQAHGTFGTHRMF